MVIAWIIWPDAGACDEEDHCEHLVPFLVQVVNLVRGFLARRLPHVIKIDAHFVGQACSSIPGLDEPERCDQEELT